MTGNDFDDETPITLERDALLELLDACLTDDDLEAVRSHITALRGRVAAWKPGGIEDAVPSADQSVTFPRDVLLADLDQILATHTLQRTRYYIARLRKAAVEVRTGAINDINLNRWKEYDEIITDSLWVMERRDNSGAHKAWYWGNFIPQIPHQMLLRYTKRGDWVLDTFVGSGTTLLECLRLGRNGIGVELNPDIAARTREIVAAAPNPHGVVADVVQGDSRKVDYAAMLAERGIAQVQLVLMHPPYHDIIRFSEDDRDLSNAASVDVFVAQFAEIVGRVTPFLERERYLTIVIGDKYVKGEWIPLGFYLMQAVMAQGYKLKSIIVKNFDATRGKREQKELWRYRALVGGFYIFKHEYILLFQK
ncbi:MAG TPA: DNA methyltransferase [Anaerolineae bacterium]|nr:DNA methyltransferase [Anaerolineae bacterium]HQH37631.1 DNA methyltransferase [Anaerolineae bacterium]